MAALPSLKDKTVAVMGLGKAGLAAARALQGSGAEVWAWDDKPEARVAGQAIGLHLVDLSTADLTGIDMMVWSPGIPHRYPTPHPASERARLFGLAPICDVELLARACPMARFIAVTGTNGKSTTTTLTGHVLAASGAAVAVGGNLGTPAIDLPPLDSDGTYVLELSSYQLELLDRAAFDIGVLLNITPDHLARHGGMPGYVRAKASLFDRMRPGGVAIVGVDDEPCREICDRLGANGRAYVIPVSAERRVPGGVSAPDGVLVDDCDGHALPVIDLAAVTALPGRHNWQNACAAYAAARAAGVTGDAVARALRTYPGLAHRQETIAVIDGVRYVNDSKATNADAAEKAMVCYEAIYWILGGQAKEGGITSLEPLFGRVRRAFLIGEATPLFARTLQGRVPFDECGTLAVAVQRASRAAVADGVAGAVVLLSPACASWDQFTSFEHRGDEFRRFIAGLPGRRSEA
jgi:UDP-N-acetylmuramoylalanine--D-glutamate ligase